MFSSAVVVVAALTLLPPVAAPAPQKSGPQFATLKGKFLVPEEGGEVVFKAGGKKFVVDLEKAMFQKHSVKKLKDVRAGTRMVLFAKFTPWSDGDEYERMSCLVAGKHYVPKHKKSGESMPSWHVGHLSFNSNRTIAYVNGAVLPTGVDRNVCFIDDATFEEFFVTRKNGKKKAKTAFVRGTYEEREVDGKRKKVFRPRLFTLPVSGIPSKEYQYILDPSKLYRDAG